MGSNQHSLDSSHRFDQVPLNKDMSFEMMLKIRFDLEGERMEEDNELFIVRRVWGPLGGVHGRRGLTHPMF